MYKKIIVALSLNHGFAERAIQAARNLLDDDGEIIAIHVFEPVHNAVSLYVPKDYIEKVRATSEEEITKRVGSGSDIKTVMLTGNAGRVITEYAEKIAADCIIAGSHKPGLQDFFLGSTAARIMRYAPCSVHILR